jgi:polar amino acid transport system substrate-binding protein
VKRLAQASSISKSRLVAIAGSGYASHAEVNFVPRNLAALIPNEVPFAECAYSTIAAIGRRGVRLARPELSETPVRPGLID